MFANAKALVVLVSCALVAQAQSGTISAPPSHSSAPAGLDTCITDCLTTAAASGGCSSYTDLSCVCTSTAFQSAAASCLETNCTASDIATAQQLQSQVCGTLSTGGGALSTATAPKGSGAASASAAKSTSTTKSASATGSASTTKAATSAAMALSPSFSLGNLIGTLVASAGALVGAGLIL